MRDTAQDEQIQSQSVTPIDKYIVLLWCRYMFSGFWYKTQREGQKRIMITSKKLHTPQGLD